ncbi:UNVERIFIED_CONTAM: hypothetical protein GTU68_011394 [Idotea baltica]|nr:hypothetical protein [Idotea baltica]
MTPDEKAEILIDLAHRLESHQEDILRENKKDLDRMDDGNPKKDRLKLTKERISGLCQSLKDVAKLPDPTHQLLSEKTLDNGLQVQKISVPLGVVGIIYESRPNVTVDVAALGIRSGNGVVLRGGSDAMYSNSILVKLIRETLSNKGIDDRAIQLLPTDREFVKEMLTADGLIDIIIPRGSQALIDFVRANATVPTIETGAGVCHTYVEASADQEKAAEIVVNAKTSRPSVCNALDTILVDESIAAEFLPKLKTGFAVFDKINYPRLSAATEESFGKEYLDFQCSVKVVQGPKEALQHIRTYSSKHSEANVSENDELCEQFLRQVDAAAVYANASTRFTDGGVFGLGAEIGISTQKLHARGPFALEKLVTEKWIIRGGGQIR